MRSLTILLAFIGFVGTAAVAQTPPADAPATAVNTACPISGNPIDGRTFTRWNDRTVGLCCGGCLGRFEAWEDTRKTKFVASALRRTPATEPPTSRPARKSAPKPTPTPASDAPVPMSELYTLDTCIVSGKTLGSMGDPVVKTYDGREVRFCCNGCVTRFEADPVSYWKRIDAVVLRDQLRIYPTDMCLVTDEPLTERGGIVDYVHNNRLVRFCCRGCVRRFRQDPAPVLAKLDALIADAQRPDYPLGTCVVAGGELGSMGEPAEIVAANRLVRFCCAGCTGAFRADPVKHLGLVDAAWKRSGGMPGAAARRGAGDRKGDHDHDHGHGHGHGHDHPH